MFFRNKIGEGEIHSTTGLWKSCVIVSGHTECRDYTCSSGTSSCGKILAARKLLLSLLHVFFRFFRQYFYSFRW